MFIITNEYVIFLEELIIAPKVPVQKLSVYIYTPLEDRGTDGQTDGIYFGMYSQRPFE